MILDRNVAGDTLLSYTVTNDRGWNDPPVHIFSPGGANGNAKRNRIDLRKRVAHNLTFQNATSQPSTPQPSPYAYQQPSPPVYHPNITAFNDQPMNQHAADFTRNFQQAAIQHSSSNPDIHQLNEISQMTHALSVPHDMNRKGQSLSPTPARSGYETPPKNNPYTMNGSGHSTPPKLPANSNGVLTPPHQFRRVSVPSGEIMNGHLGTPSMLQMSHLTPANVGSISNSPVRLHEPPCPTQNGPNSLPCPAVQQVQMENNFYARSNSAPGIRRSPTNVVGPPPTTGFYAQKYQSSNGSPVASGNQSPVLVNSKLENDVELLENTLRSLFASRDKCACGIPAKTNDDIGKRLNALKEHWSAGRLSTSVKLQLSQLSTALAANDVTKADKLLKTLILDHSNEVMPWIVGVKKLIAATTQSTLMGDNY